MRLRILRCEALNTANLGVLEVFHRLTHMQFGSFAPVKDKGIDVIGYNRNKFIALQIKTSKKHFDRYLPRGAQYSYWWEISKMLHREILSGNVFYVFVGVHFDQRERNAIDYDFFIINSLELEKLFADRKFKYDTKNQKWRVEVYLDKYSNRFLSAYDSSCDLSDFHNAWWQLVR